MSNLDIQGSLVKLTNGHIRQDQTRSEQIRHEFQSIANLEAKYLKKSELRKKTAAFITKNIKHLHQSALSQKLILSMYQKSRNEKNTQKANFYRLQRILGKNKNIQNYQFFADKAYRNDDLTSEYIFEVNPNFIESQEVSLISFYMRVGKGIPSTLKVVRDEINRAVSTFLSLTLIINSQNIPKSLKNALLFAQKSIAQNHYLNYYRAGVSVTLILLHKNKAYCANLGPTRIAIISRERSPQGLEHKVLPNYHSVSNPLEQKRLRKEKIKIDHKENEFGDKIGPIVVDVPSNDIPYFVTTRCMGYFSALKSGLRNEPEVETVDLGMEKFAIFFGSVNFWKHMDSPTVCRTLRTLIYRRKKQTLLSELYRQFEINRVKDPYSMHNSEKSVCMGILYLTD